MSPLEEPTAGGGTATAAGLRRSDFLRRSAVAGVVATGAGASLAGPALAHGGKKHAASSPLDQKGLHNRLNHISHFDVNVSDRARSRAWYEATTPLRVVAETSADQAFPSFGFARGRFEGYMMKDPAQVGASPMIHLVEWKDPRPVGTPYLSQANVGWYRIVPGVADIEAARQAVIAQGSEPFAPTTDVMIRFSPGPLSRYQVFAVHDPDGTTLEFAQSATPITPILVAHNTTDPDRYISFYLGTLGLDFVSPLQTEAPAPNVYSPLGGITELSGALFGIRGDGRHLFDWLEWTESDQFPTPYQEHNHLGIIRCALEVDDLDAAYRTLKRSDWAKKRRIVLGPPEEWDYGEAFGTRRVLNFADPEGVYFQLLQQPPSNAQLHPFTGGDNPFD